MKEECERAQNKKKIMAEKLETIINSQKQYEKKWEKIYRYLTFYREFYFKSIFIIYKNKLSHEFLDNENKLNELIGLESIQSRLNKEITKSPRLLLDISMNMIEMDFDLQKSIKNNNDDNLRKKEFFDDNEKNNNGNFNSHKDINESNRKNIFPYLDTFFQMDSAHINKLPFFDEVKIMQNQYPKRRLSKTQVFDCSPNYKILGEDKSENQNDKINELNKSQLFDYGKKMKIFVEKKIISPLSKSINEENDFKFISKNNIDFSTHKKQMNHNMIEEIFL